MTSNIGTEFAQKGATLGFLRPGEAETSGEKEAHQKIKDDLKKTFRPEFLNRIDEIIIFHTLSQGQVRQIVDLQMKEISARLAEQGLTVELTEAAQEWLAKEGYDPQFGARPLKRTLQRRVESPLSVKLLDGVFQSGDTVVIDVGKEGLVFAQKGVPVEEADFVKKEEVLVKQRT
jgi:ATP-dependent Clp protease ATP-binding subunit ClpC